MSKTGDEIREWLKNDMVSHGWILQCLKDQKSLSKLRDVLTELLPGEVEIGDAKIASPNHVEFIAWKGSIDERLVRAIATVNRLKGHDQEFAYWLALRENVDRFELK
jgi:hypothetical protein